jgi:glycosyltransferase involved in cell wall biosynthesis
MSRLCLYYIREPERDRWLPGDRYIRPSIRRLVRGVSRPGGVDKVFINLRLGLNKLGIQYEVNLPFKQLRKGDRVGILGRGLSCLNGYDRSNPIVAGIGLMTHPSEWPDLCQQYPVVKYLQHSHWANDVYKPYFGERCTIWPVGIDTDFWQPAPQESKSVDFLIYNKIRWDYDQRVADLLTPIRQLLTQQGLSFEELRYGSYKQEDYQKALNHCRAMIFLCEHESQGIAYQECLSSGVPILAWDQGQCLDPNRFTWGMPHISATSVPFFDEHCGVKFKDMGEFPTKLEEFLDKLNSQQFAPRDYILENLTLEKCAQHYIEILAQV